MMQETIATVCLSTPPLAPPTTTLSLHLYVLYIYVSRTPHSFPLLIDLATTNSPLSSFDHLTCSFGTFPLITHSSKAMKFFDKSQVLMLVVLALLLVITTFLPSSLRPSYLYFIFNVLIIALGAEAGLLSAFSEPLEDRKQAVNVITPHEEEVIPEEREASKITSGSSVSEHNEKKPKVAEKYACDEKIVFGVTEVDKVKNCPSMPSLFFVGGGEEAELEVMDEEVEAEDESGGVSGQELFAKAEAFIGNFYKQLKMQREESWIYQKAY